MNIKNMILPILCFFILSGIFAIAGDTQPKAETTNGFVLVEHGDSGSDSRPEPSLPGNAEPGTGYDPSGNGSGGTSTEQQVHRLDIDYCTAECSRLMDGVWVTFPCAGQMRKCKDGEGACGSDGDCEPR